MKRSRRVIRADQETVTRWCRDGRGEVTFGGVTRIGGILEMFLFKTRRAVWVRLEGAI